MQAYSPRTDLDAETLYADDEHVARRHLLHRCA
jgi:hypothetical protein